VLFSKKFLIVKISITTASPKTCKISKGTTLKELATFFKLTEEQLKRYQLRGIKIRIVLWMI